MLASRFNEPKGDTLMATIDNLPDNRKLGPDDARAARMREALDRSPMTQQAFADTVDVSTRAVQWALRTGGMFAGTCRRYAAALGVDAEWLAYGRTTPADANEARFAGIEARLRLLEQRAA